MFFFFFWGGGGGGGGGARGWGEGRGWGAWLLGSHIGNDERPGFSPPHTTIHILRCRKIRLIHDYGPIHKHLLKENSYFKITKIIENVFEHTTLRIFIPIHKENILKHLLKENSHYTRTKMIVQEQ